MLNPIFAEGLVENQDSLYDTQEIVEVYSDIDNYNSEYSYYENLEDPTSGSYELQYLVADDEVQFISDEYSERKLIPVVLKVKYQYNSKTKEFDISVNADAPTALNKPDISLAVTVKQATSKNGAYLSISNGYKEFGKINYIMDYKISIPAATGHYKVYCEVKSLNSSQAIAVADNNIYIGCINRTGHIWTSNYTDKISGKSVSEPYTAWKKEQIYNRVNVKDPYKKWYDSTYSTNLNLTGYDVHHIRPLAYGGSNDVSNLIHLQATFHQKITNWFAGY